MKQFKKMSFIAFILVFLSLFNIVAPISYGIEETGEINILFVAYFAYWKDPSSGRWLYDDASGRHSFNGPNSTVYSFDFPSVEVSSGEYKIKNIQTYSGNPSDYPNFDRYTSLNDSEISRHKPGSYHLNNTSQHIGKIGKVTINSTLNLLGLDDSKREEIGGIWVYTTYVPVVVTLVPSLDIIVVKYQDESGKTLKADDKYIPTKQGYYSVEAAVINGYDLTSHPVGKEDVWISGAGKEIEVIFVYKKNGGTTDPDPGGASGNVEITFVPNSTQEIGGKTKDGSSYWVNKDIVVRVTATGEIEVTHSASRSYSYTYEYTVVIPPGPDGTGGGTETRTGSGSGSEDWPFTQIYTPAQLKIGGTAGVNTTIPNGSTVTIKKEEINMILTGEVAGWNKQSPVWADGDPSPSPPQGTVTSTSWSGGSPPDAPQPTDKFPAESGHYSLDKTPPVIEIDYSPIKDKWSNRDFQVTVYAHDRSSQGASGVSGFNDSYFDITNVSYTGNHSFMGKRDIPHSHNGSYSYSQSITINRDGVYQISVNIKDLAGNDGEIYINGRRVSTNGSWREGDLPLDKTDPEPARFSVINNGFVAPKTIANVTPKASSYVVSGEAPGFEYTVDKTKNMIVVHIDDNLSGTGSDATYDSDTDNTRFQYAWSKDYRTLTEGGWINYSSSYTSSNDILDEHINPTWSQPGYGRHLGRTDIFFDPHLNLNYYGQLLEGQWYLHIRQIDRAGNITQTVSPPIFFNKIKNLRIINAHDYLWRDIFEKGNGDPSDVQIQGIRVKDMPLFKNRFGHYIGLGYRVTFEFDTVGFEEVNDTIQIGIKYHALDNKGNLYRDVDIYLPNKNGDYVEISDVTNPKYDSELQQYYNILKLITLRANSDNRKAYEDYNELDTLQRNRQTRDLSKSKYNTYEHFTFLPHTARVVRRGYPLDLIRGENTFNHKLLVTFDVVGKKGHNQLANLDYTGKEDQWGVVDKWHNKDAGDYNVYGKNKPTNADLIGKGINAGEFFYYDLTRSVLNDIKQNRRW